MIITHNGTILTNDGVVLNNIITSPSFPNTYSLDFDGVDDYVEIGTQSLGITEAISISAWVKIPISGVWAAPYVQGICVENGTSGINWTLTFRPPPFFNYFAFTVYHTNGTSTTLTSSGVTPNDGQWHHLLATSDGTTNANGVKLYVDGVLNVQATAASTGTRNTPTVIPTIGSTSNNSWFFEGNIDEVSIFDSAISIGDVWDGSGTPNDLSLLATPPTNWYRMGDNGAYKSPQWLIPSNENKDKVSNYSFEFDGVDDDFTSGDLSALVDNKSKLSISFWVNLPNASEINRITGKYGGSLTKWLGVTCTANKVSFVVSNIGSSLAYADTNTVLTDNTWHHVVCVFDGTQATATDRIKIYIDNTNETFGFNGTLPTSTYDFTLEPTNPTWYVAQIGLQLGINELRGKLGEYAIYSDVSLTPSEVSDIYNGGTPNDLNTLSFTPDLWYKMGEEAKFTSNWLVDNSALTNYSKRSFEFDGVDDYVNCGSLSNLQNATEYSISSWFKTPLNNQYQVIYSWFDGADGYLQLLLVDDGSFIVYNYRTAQAYGLSATGLVSANTWYNGLVVFDGSGATDADRLKLYLNGSLINLTFTGTIPTQTGTMLQNRFHLGAYVTVTGTFTWTLEGNIDEVSIFNSAISIGDVWDGSGQPIDVSAVSGIVNNYRMGEDASFGGTNWTVPDNVGSNNGTSNAMMVDALVGEAPNYSGGGISNAMTIEDRVGEAPNSENNALSFNMDLIDRVEDTPTP